MEDLEGKDAILRGEITAQLNQIFFNIEQCYKEVLQCNEELEAMMKALQIQVVDLLKEKATMGMSTSTSTMEVTSDP